MAPDRTKPLPIKAGQIVLWTSGSYSGYGVCGIFRAKVDFTVPARVSRYREPYHDFQSCATNPALVDQVEYIEAWCEE